jgi:hypothetical protein
MYLTSPTVGPPPTQQLVSGGDPILQKALLGDYLLAVKFIRDSSLMVL